MKNINQELLELENKNLLRTLKTIGERDGIKVKADDQKFLNFSSNDYLGLSENQTAIIAMNKAANEFGVGATASRLICGHSKYHVSAENKLATLKSRNKALLFPTGFMTNLGIFTALTDKNDAIILDRLSHASMVDAAKLSKAKLLVFEHNNPESLNKILNRNKNKYSNIYVATEGVFSMDGDIAPIPELLEVCNKHNAYLIVDEAHSTGVIGKTGRGIEEHFGMENGIHLIMGTCSKALGVQGGFVAGDGHIIDYLITKARSFIYTTGISPVIAAAVEANVQYLLDNPSIINEYHGKLNYTNTKLEMNNINSRSDSAIFPLILGTNEATLEAVDKLKKQGILAVAIREPTVPKGTARIRFTITNQHDIADIDLLVENIKKTIS